MKLKINKRWYNKNNKNVNVSSFSKLINLYNKDETFIKLVLGTTNNNIDYSDEINNDDLKLKFSDKKENNEDLKVSNKTKYSI